MRDFYSWLNTFRKYISDYHYYINFETVYKNTNKYKVELNIINSLIVSKEVARSYKNIAQQVEKIPNLTFIWITDGQGWFDAKHNLKETFDILETIYNINDLENNVLKSLS